MKSTIQRVLDAHHKAMALKRMLEHGQAEANQADMEVVDTTSHVESKPDHSPQSDEATAAIISENNNERDGGVGIQTTGASSSDDENNPANNDDDEESEFGAAADSNDEGSDYTDSDDGYDSELDSGDESVIELADFIKIELKSSGPRRQPCRTTQRYHPFLRFV
jgi:hypothetical protein